MDVQIQTANKATPKVLEGVNRLIPQISKKANILTPIQLERILGQNQFYFLFAYIDEKIAGMAIICYHRIATKPNGFGRIEDVVVDQDYRRRGIASQIMDELHEIAKIYCLDQVELTSNPEREVANKMYQKLGYKLRDTNVYTFTP